MCAEWVRGSDVGLLARKLEVTKVVREGRTFFEGTAAEDARAVLLSSLKFEPGVPEIEQVRILDASVRSSGAAGRVTKEALMTEVNRREEDYNLP